jgi:hypothetical protein
MQRGGDEGGVVSTGFFFIDAENDAHLADRQAHRRVSFA